MNYIGLDIHKKNTQACVKDIFRVVGVLVPASRHAENVRAPSLATRRADRDDRYADETRIIGNDVQGLYRSDRGHTLGGDGQACTKRPKPVNILRVITLTPARRKWAN